MRSAGVMSPVVGRAAWVRGSSPAGAGAPETDARAQAATANGRVADRTKRVIRAKRAWWRCMAVVRAWRDKVTVPSITPVRRRREHARLPSHQSTLVRRQRVAHDEMYIAELVPEMPLAECRGVGHGEVRSSGDGLQ